MSCLLRSQGQSVAVMQSIIDIPLVMQCTIGMPLCHIKSQLDSNVKSRSQRLCRAWPGLRFNLGLLVLRFLRLAQ